MGEAGIETQLHRSGYRPTCYREWPEVAVFFYGVQLSDVAELSWTTGRICLDGSIRRTKQVAKGKP